MEIVRDYIEILRGAAETVAGYISRVSKYIAETPRSSGDSGNNRAEDARNVRERRFHRARFEKDVAGASRAPPRLSWYILSAQKYIEMVPRRLGKRR